MALLEQCLPAGRQCGLVMGQLHSDLHDNHVTSQLSHVMSTSIEITSSLQPGVQYSEYGHSHNDCYNRLPISTPTTPSQDIW